MATSRKSDNSNGHGQDARHDDTAASQADGGDFVVTGTIDGKIRDIEVGLITGDVTQTNDSGQGSSNISIGGDGGSQAIDQAASQTNTLVVEGDAALDITVNGEFKGQIRDIEVGLITGDVTQTNVSGQAAGNLSVGGAGGSQTIDQAAVQENFLAAVGNVEVSIVFNGDFKGQIRDIEVGLITGDITQTNDSSQGASNVSLGGDGGSQAIGQSAGQSNFLAAVGDVDITLVFEGDFKGQVRDISIGVLTGDVTQTNTSVQVGMNLSVGGHAGSQAIEQFITQTNFVHANGDVDITIRFDPSYRGDYRDIGIGLEIDNVLQSNSGAQFASNTATDPVWG